MKQGNLFSPIAECCSWGSYASSAGSSSFQNQMPWPRQKLSEPNPSLCCSSTLHTQVLDVHEAMMAGSRIPCQVILTHHRAVRPRARACQDTGSADSSTGNHWNTAERPSRCLTKLPQLVEQTAKRIRLPDTHLIEWQSYHDVTGPSETRWSLPLELLPILSLSIGSHCLATHLCLSSFRM